MNPKAPPAGWYPDFSKRFEQRYWDGTQWTEHVFSAGNRAVDPVDGNRANVSADVESTASAAATSIGAGWDDIEVEGEFYRRSEISRVFRGIGRPEGGVTMQVAQLIPEPTNSYDRNAVKVIVRGEHVGYVPAEMSAPVARACKGLGRGVVATVPVRMWARVDEGTWRARVTLAFSGSTESEKDYAADRRAMEAAVADREAESARKAAEREERDRLKSARREAGAVRGEYWPTWKSPIAELKRQKRLEEARDLLVECRDAADREAAVTGEMADPWPAEQLSAVQRRLGDRVGELATLERYVADCGDRVIPDSVTAKLAKARIANGGSI